jgi:hypothetical protein
VILDCSQLAGFEEPKTKADPPQSWFASGASEPSCNGKFFVIGLPTGRTSDQFSAQPF